MQRDFVNIDYQIEFEAPFHLGTGLRRDLLDRSVCRDVNDYLYIPGSTLKGVFRERCEQIAKLVGLHPISPHDTQRAIAGFCHNNINIVDRIFGSRYKPGELYFDNATIIETDKEFFDSDSGQVPKHYIHLQTEARTQTSISRLLGTVREQALLQSEFGLRELCFKGQICGHLEGFRLFLKEAWSYSLLLLIAGICANDRIGGSKSIGIGKYTCQIQKLEFNDETIEVIDLLASLDELELYQDVQKDYYAQKETE